MQTAALAAADGEKGGEWASGHKIHQKWLNDMSCGSEYEL